MCWTKLILETTYGIQGKDVVTMCVFSFIMPVAGVNNCQNISSENEKKKRNNLGILHLVFTLSTVWCRVRLHEALTRQTPYTLRHVGDIINLWVCTYCKTTNFPLQLTLLNFVDHNVYWVFFFETVSFINLGLPQSTYEWKTFRMKLTFITWSCMFTLNWRKNF